MYNSSTASSLWMLLQDEVVGREMRAVDRIGKALGVCFLRFLVWVLRGVFMEGVLVERSDRVHLGLEIGR